MSKLEKEIEEALKDTVTRHGGKCLKWVCPGWSGVPDRIILLPGGRVLFAETKRPKGGKISKMQQWWAEQLRHLGFQSVIVKDLEDVKWVELMIQSEKGVRP